MAGHKHGFPKNGRGIFFVSGLDSECSVESAREFRFLEQAILRPRGGGQVMPDREDRTDLSGAVPELTGSASIKLN